jgi:ribonuclease VapC
VIAVDTSALVAIILGEPERERFLAAIRGSGKALISTTSLVEARLVVHGRRGQRGVVLLDDIVRHPIFELVAPGSADADAAYAAFVTFGKGSGHPANLNFGDLFSYALAKTHQVPLLFKGDDFAHTDIERADAP